MNGRAGIGSPWVGVWREGDSILDIQNLEVADRFDHAINPVVVPIRHHSPACAWHTRKLIELVQPTHIFVEGPSDANELIDPLLDAKTVPPVAVYAFVRQGEDPAGPKGSASLFYPFCDYSPELVALRAAKEISAVASFIDLPSWRMADPSMTDAPKVNAYADRELAHHRYLDVLCRRMNVRGFDELWDSLFESAGGDLSSDEYFSQVGTYGRIAREQSSSLPAQDRQLHVREQAMAYAIDQASRAGGRVLAVVGAFHRAGILSHLAEGPVAEVKLPKPPKDRGIYLTIYGQEQLDRWSGYDAGMPAPEFYQQNWEHRGEPTRVLIARQLARVASVLRRAGEIVSTADLIGAASHLEGLCRLRGHSRPTLDDLRDSLRTAWLKTNAEDGGRWMGLVESALVGSRVGKVSERAGRPPIVEDFHQSLKRLNFVRSKGVAELTAAREISLDIYRDPKHRLKSAFLHQLRELHSPFAKRLTGPDFVQQTDSDRVRETWKIRWKPSVEANLVEAAPLGSSILEAATQHLLRRYAQEGRLSARSAVEQLTSALVMGLVDWTASLWDQVESAIEAEGSFFVAAKALAGLIELTRYRPILQPERVAGLTRLLSLAYRRSVWLLDTLAGLPPSDPVAVGQATPLDRLNGPADQALEGLLLVRHAALSPVGSEIDPELFVSALEWTADRLESHPLLEGAVLGILRRWDRVSSEQLARAMRHRAEHAPAGSSPLGEFVRGVVTVRRFAIIEDEGLLEVLHEQIGRGDEELFRQWLPTLRMAFARLAPAELQRLSEKVDALMVGPRRDPHRAEDAVDVRLGQSIDAAIGEVLPRLPWYAAKEITPPA
jgi:hypothetical protein